MEREGIWVAQHGEKDAAALPKMVRGLGFREKWRFQHLHSTASLGFCRRWDSVCMAVGGGMAVRRGRTVGAMGGYLAVDGEGKRDGQRCQLRY